MLPEMIVSGENTGALVGGLVSKRAVTGEIVGDFVGQLVGEDVGRWDGMLVVGDTVANLPSNENWRSRPKYSPNFTQIVSALGSHAEYFRMIQILNQLFHVPLVPLVGRILQQVCRTLPLLE